MSAVTRRPALGVTCQSVAAAVWGRDTLTEGRTGPFGGPRSLLRMDVCVRRSQSRTRIPTKGAAHGTTTQSRTGQCGRSGRRCPSPHREPTPTQSEGSHGEAGTVPRPRGWGSRRRQPRRWSRSSDPAGAPCATRSPGHHGARLALQPRGPPAPGHGAGPRSSPSEADPGQWPGSGSQGRARGSAREPASRVCRNLMRGNISTEATWCRSRLTSPPTPRLSYH